MQKELLRMENIVKTFPGVKALNNAAITVHAGEVMGFMGENGAGKSTLMNVLGGVFPADSGDIYIEGKKVAILRLWELHLTIRNLRWSHILQLQRTSFLEER